MYKLTSEGKDYLSKGLPEKKLLEALKPGKKLFAEVNVPQKEIAVNWAKRNGWIVLEQGYISLTQQGSKAQRQKLDVEKALESIEKRGHCDKKVLYFLLQRKLAEELIEEKKQEEPLVDKLKQIFWQRKQKEIREVAQLSTDIIKSGVWKSVPLRKYDVTTPAPKIFPGKKQAYKAFLDEVKEELIALGFEEMTGPVVELSFFNMDSLFMPQDHPARGIHDLYFVKNPTHGSVASYADTIKNVKETHENGWTTGSTGWGSKFSEKECSRLVLRSQGTAISARTLIKPGIKIPGSYFALARCYRPEKLDATHLSEFNQLEGIVLGHDVNFRNLLGLLSEFARKIAGAEKIKFRPAYFPFTEPSVQGMVWHAGLGKWLEILPAGIFRPELTAPLGIKAPVLAWGIGIDRLFMIRENISDIRQLFSSDIKWLREAKI